MTAYILAQIEATNLERFREYEHRLPATLGPFGGQILVWPTGHQEAIEQDLGSSRIVILEFPSTEQAQAWYHSSAYQAIRPLREQSARTHMAVVVEGRSVELSRRGQRPGTLAGQA